MESTNFFDKNGVEILPTSDVLYTDTHHGVVNESGYIVKNLQGTWEVRNYSGQTGNSLENVIDLEVIK